MEPALYLFCLARSGLLPELRITGLNDDTPVIAEAFSDVTAVVCEVPLEEFSGPSAEAKLQDLMWVGPRAVRHDQVIAGARRYSPVLPARFGTLFSSRESLARLVECNIVEINSFLDSVTGKDEWSVKGLVSKGEMRERLFAEKSALQRESLDSLSPGVRYFKEKQIRAEADKEMGRRLKEIVNSVALRLNECSSNSRRREVVFPPMEGSDRETVVNWAFLVETEVAGDFADRVDLVNRSYGESGIFFELSGPWPPYSFAPPLEWEPET